MSDCLTDITRKILGGIRKNLEEDKKLDATSGGVKAGSGLTGGLIAGAIARKSSKPGPVGYGYKEDDAGCHTGGFGRSKPGGCH